ITLGGGVDAVISRLRPGLQHDGGAGLARQRRNALPDLFGNEGHERVRSEEHTSELQSRENLVCRLLLEKKKWQNRLPRLPVSCLTSTRRVSVFVVFFSGSRALRDLPSFPTRRSSDLITLGGGVDAVISRLRPGLQHDGGAGLARQRRNALPDLFGNEGHERV